MGIFFAVSYEISWIFKVPDLDYWQAILLGLPLAPMVGGALATYASWRLMQVLLAAMGLGITIVVFVYLPETSHPGVRGLDKWNAQRRVKNIENGTHGEENKDKESWHWVWLSPLSTLTLLKSPVILLLVKGQPNANFIPILMPFRSGSFVGIRVDDVLW